MAWELIFMLLLLKIPLFYLCGVVWYAVKAEPSVDDAPDEPTPVREPLQPRPSTDRARRWVGRGPLRPARRPDRRRAPLTRLGARG